VGEKQLCFAGAPEARRTPDRARSRCQAKDRATAEVAAALLYHENLHREAAAVIITPFLDR
jgi:hypothetical protein